jgi:uncharacterized membrane protein
MQNFKEVKLEIFVPQDHAMKLADALSEIGVGVIGNYDHCVALTPVRGFFRPREGADPFEGTVGEINEVAEYKLEVNCKRELVKDAIEVIKRVHPYEEPLINVIPLAIVAWKGLVAGTFSFFLAWSLGNPFPNLKTILGTLILGFVCYGLSTMLFIRSMRGLGAARTSALYGTAPLAGVILSIILFRELPSFLFVIAAILMIGGALLLINENHAHSHTHTVLFHEHSHSHADPAHGHGEAQEAHSHEHEHPAEEHTHDHMPDIHHRHGHEE